MNMSIIHEFLQNIKPGSRLESVQEDYGRLAPDYEARWNKFLTASRQWILKRFPKNLPENAHVIDLGCGTGAFLKQIHEIFPQYELTGIDGSYDMLDQARLQDVPAGFSQADLDRVNLAHNDDRYDVILSMNVLHHLDDPEDHLSQIRQIVNSNGTVFLCDYAIDTPLMKAADLFWRTFQSSYTRGFSSPELQEILKHLGYRIKAKDVLKPNAFWAIQIYQLTVK